MIAIVREKIDREAVLQAVRSESAGALLVFEGTVRNRARGRKVTRLYYEAYPKMALQELRSVCENACGRWRLDHLAIVHRVGRLEIGETSVLIAVSSPHRDEAFQACRFAIEQLKTRVPIWKKEEYEDGAVWIEGTGG